MKRKILFGLLALVTAGGIVYSADHIDAPSLTNADGTGTANDIADIYAFQSPGDNSKMVFVMTWQGLMSPAKTATFNIPNNQLFEFAIDNTGDNVEDLVIQAKVQDNSKFRVYGPVAPTSTGNTSSIATSGSMLEGTVTQYTSSSPDIATGSTGIKSFIGPRDDPFFFDIVRFREIIAGTQTSFRNPGVNTFAGTNVLAWVVEVPKAMLGSAATINVWGKIKTK
jgi:hypothetical protein